METSKGVTQADREAAWSFRPEGYGPVDRGAWNSGLCDHNRHIQAFARHRLAHTVDATDGEREAVLVGGESTEGSFLALQDQLRIMYHAQSEAIDRLRSYITTLSVNAHRGRADDLAKFIRESATDVSQRGLTVAEAVLRYTPAAEGG